MQKEACVVDGGGLGAQKGLSSDPDSAPQL